MLVEDTTDPFGFKKKIPAFLAWFWRKFGWTLHKDQQLQEAGKHSGCYEHISCFSSGIQEKKLFGRQRLIRWLPSTSIFRKMLRCKSQFTKYAKIYISTLFTPQYKLLNKISMLIPNLINQCIQRLYILHQGCLLQGHPALDRVPYAAGHQK